MRFTRFPRVVPYVVTPRKLAYARRAIQHARDKCPLFPELTDQRTVEQRMEDNARHSRLYWQDMRDTQAASWREARRELGSRGKPASPGCRTAAPPRRAPRALGPLLVRVARAGGKRPRHERLL